MQLSFCLVYSLRLVDTYADYVGVTITLLFVYNFKYFVVQPVPGFTATPHILSLCIYNLQVIK